MKGTKLARLALALGLVLCSGVAIPATIYEPDFTSWTHWTEWGIDGGVGAAVATVEPSGGNPGSYLSVRINASGGTVFGVHLDDQLFDPSSEGGIQTIDFTVDLKIEPLGFFAAVALQQNSRIFYLPSTNHGPQESTRGIDWSSGAWLGKTQDDFILYEGGTVDPSVHPDFSPTALPIRFGLLTAVTQGTVTRGFDNWQVITTPPPCPGDIDGDNDTDVFDFNIFAPAFGASVGDPEYVPAADLNGDDTIDVFDFNLFAPDFGCDRGPSS